MENQYYEKKYKKIFGKKKKRFDHLKIKKSISATAINPMLQSVLMVEERDRFKKQLEKEKQ